MPTTMRTDKRFLAATIRALSPSHDRADPVYVHAKVAVIDDRWLIVGSANLNAHSLFNDTEMCVVTDDAALARDTRVRLWAEHLEMDEAEIREADRGRARRRALAPDRRRAARAPAGRPAGHPPAAGAAGSVAAVRAAAGPAQRAVRPTARRRAGASPRADQIPYDARVRSAGTQDIERPRRDGRGRHRPPSSARRRRRCTAARSRSCASPGPTACSPGATSCWSCAGCG